MQSEKSASNSFVLVAFFFEAGLGAAAIVIGWSIGFDALAKLKIDWNTSPDLWKAAAAGLLAAVPLFLGLLLIERMRFGPFLNLNRVVETRLVGLFTGLTNFELAALSIAAGFGEEVLFRGLMQAGLTNWIGPPNGLVWAIALSAFLFGICHWITPTYAVLAACVSVYLGMLFVLTDSLLAPLVAHSAYDFAALIYLTRKHVHSVDGEA